MEREGRRTLAGAGYARYSYAINKKRGTRHGELVDDSDGETDTASLCALCSLEGYDVLL
jgi:hypothetical protein